MIKPKQHPDHRFSPCPSGSPARTARQGGWALRCGPVLLAAMVMALAAPGSAKAQAAPQPKLPTTPLTAGMHIIQAELAISPAQQQVGMMMRTEMGNNEGMLFVNEDSQVRCFWMKNTLLPLSIAFVADDGTIVNIADMEPRSEASHCSTKPVRFALEMRQGWFAKRGLAAGTKLLGAPFSK